MGKNGHGVWLCDACSGCPMLAASARDPTLSASYRERAGQLWASVLSYCCSVSLLHQIFNQFTSVFF